MPNEVAPGANEEMKTGEREGRPLPYGLRMSFLGGWGEFCRNRMWDNPSVTATAVTAPFTQGGADYNNKCNTKKIDFTETTV